MEADSARTGTKSLHNFLTLNQQADLVSYLILFPLSS